MRHRQDAFWQFFWPLLATAGAVFVLAIIVYFIRWWLRENDDPAEPVGNLLSQYREMHEQGELTDEEYRLIKGRIARGRTQAAPTPSAKLPPRPEPASGADKEELTEPT